MPLASGPRQECQLRRLNPPPGSSTQPSSLAMGGPLWRPRAAGSAGGRRGGLRGHGGRQIEASQYQPWHCTPCKESNSSAEEKEGGVGQGEEEKEGDLEEKEEEQEKGEEEEEGHPGADSTEHAVRHETVDCSFLSFTPAVLLCGAGRSLGVPLLGGGSLRRWRRWPPRCTSCGGGTPAPTAGWLASSKHCSSPLGRKC